MAGSAGRVGQQAAELVDKDTVHTVGKVGVAGLGVVYLLLAWLSVQVALGTPGSGQSADNTGALKELAGNTLGTLLLGLLVIGFTAYALWQGYEAIAGYRYLDGAKRAMKRVGAGAKALLGASLAYTSFRLVTGGSQKDSSRQQEDLTAKLLGLPGGQLIVILAGLVIIGIAAYIGYRGITRSFLEKLQGSVSHGVELLGVVGYVARAVVFAILGVLVVVAGFQADPDKSGGLDQALRSLAGQPFGTVLLLAVAAGLAAFGVYELVTARQAREG